MMKMKLNKAPFEQIKNGKKTVELRLNDEKRRAITIGDEMVFTLMNDEAQMLRSRVVALYKYDSFKELFEDGLLEATGFMGYTTDEACATMHTYYTAEQERKYGVLGIKIELIED
jgi:ASC-1-like (ASCH) protein